MSEDAFFVDGVKDEEAVLGWEGNIVVLGAEGQVREGRGRREGERDLGNLCLFICAFPGRCL